MAAFALLVFSLVCRVQTGVRLLLPMIPLAVVGLSASLVVAQRVRLGSASAGVDCELRVERSLAPLGVRVRLAQWPVLHQ